jgi:hypothetical protein
VNGGEMPEQVVDPISAGRDLTLEVFVAERVEGLVELTHHLLP